MVQRRAPVKYTGGRLNADTRKLDAEAKRLAGIVDQALSARLDEIFGSTRGSILHRYASLWDILAPGMSGRFLRSNGANADLSYEVAGTQTVIAAAPNTNFDVSETSAVTIFTQAVTGIAVGDRIEVEIEYTVLNDSGAARTYTRTLEFDSFSSAFTETGTVTNHATSRMPRKESAVLSVSEDDKALLDWHMRGGSVAGAPAIAAGTGSSYAAFHMWNSTASDLTGSTNVIFKFHSSNVAATQTLTLHSYKITRTPAT